ncbi:MAG: nucleoside 2-deoxyribosyltransferase [Bacteroidales bacterium]
MKIYFAGSISGGRADKELYLLLIQHLTKHGHVLTEHIGDPNLGKAGEDGQTDEWIYQRDLEWLEESDVIVAEVSTPSLGVGYEIGRAESMKKPVLCLFRPRESQRLSAMIAGNPKLETVRYQRLEEAKTLIDHFFATQNSTKETGLPASG